MKIGLVTIPEEFTGAVPGLEYVETLVGPSLDSAGNGPELTGLSPQAEVTDPVSGAVSDRPLDIAIRDPDDAWVLAAAVAGGAELLITGDADLLTVANQSPIPVLSPRAFWERLRTT